MTTRKRLCSPSVKALNDIKVWPINEIKKSINEALTGLE